MAIDKFLSPGVFTEEIDQSALEEGVSGIGAVVVGRSPKGPAFVPVKVSGLDKWEAIFGRSNPKYLASYAAELYLKNSNSLTFVRVLGHDDGTSASSGYSVGGVTGITDLSGAISTTGSVLAVVHHSGSIAGGAVRVLGLLGDANRFVWAQYSAPGVATFVVTASFLTSSADYIGKVLNTDPTKYSTYGHYVSEIFPYQAPAASASWHTVGILSASWVDFLRDFESGSTTWVKSQPMGGNEFDLFRFHTVGSGRASNDEVKVSVQNIKQSLNPTSNPYGTFDVVVRSFYDNDVRPEIIEPFVGLTLDPDDKNYILRRIGDAFDEFDTATRKFVQRGAYPAKSKYVRVEVNATDDFPPESLPWGFRGFPKVEFSGTAVSGSASRQMIPSLPYVLSQKDGNGNVQTGFHWGVSFVSGGVADRMRAFPDLSTTDAWHTASDADFSLKHLSGTYVNGGLQHTYQTAQSAYVPIYASASLQKFTMPFRGGFDGWDLRVEDPTYLANSSAETVIGVTALKRALDTVANPDVVDMNLLTVPGVHNLKVVDRARDIANARRDVLCLFDITGSTVLEAIENLRARDIDDNYAATYYPDVKRKSDGKMVRLPSTVAALAAIAFSDRIGQPWFAPAGLTRGGLAQFGITDVVDRLDFQDRSDLYENRINPIAVFPENGIVVWGQKTMQVKSSALDRINVRRLMIFAKKTVAAAAKILVFEPNDPESWQRFRNAVNPILENVRQLRGIERFKVVMDSTTNTDDIVDRNEMLGKIFLQPTRAAEAIGLNFVITSTGVLFED